MRKFLAALLLCATTAGAFAKNTKEQWDLVGNPPEVRQWFSSLKQPDTVGGFTGGVSCCGEGDAYYADEVRVRNGKTYAVITDEREDEPLGRVHEKIGTEYEVPATKIVGQEQMVKGNPTGHVVIFLGGVSHDGDPEHRLSPRAVLCYVMNGGV